MARVGGGDRRGVDLDAERRWHILSSGVDGVKVEKSRRIDDASKDLDGRVASAGEAA